MRGSLERPGCLSWWNRTVSTLVQQNTWGYATNLAPMWDVTTTHFHTMFCSYELILNWFPFLGAGPGAWSRTVGFHWRETLERDAALKRRETQPKTVKSDMFLYFFQCFSQTYQIWLNQTNHTVKVREKKMWEPTLSHQRWEKKKQNLMKSINLL